MGFISKSVRLSAQRVQQWTCGGLARDDTLHRFRQCPGGKSVTRMAPRHIPRLRALHCVPSGVVVRAYVLNLVQPLWVARLHDGSWLRIRDRYRLH